MLWFPLCPPAALVSAPAQAEDGISESQERLCGTGGYEDQGPQGLVGLVGRHQTL
jgi:hypothetical protein